MSLLESVRIGAQRPRWMKSPPAIASSEGDAAADLAASAGLILDDWQSWWLRHALAEDASGRWAAREAVLICARQSGKNGALAALELHAMFVVGEPLIIHSAHEVPTALNHFQFMVGLIEGTPALRRNLATNGIRYKNGSESIELKNGSTLQFRARGKNSGRGLTGGRIIFDEAFQIPPSSMGALVPVMRAMPNPQMIYASSAPKADSVVLHALIKRGRADDPDDRLFYAEWGNEPGTAMDDVDAWYIANPAMGIRITEEALHDEYRTLVASGDEPLIAEFSREAVGIGEEPITDAKPAKLPADKWAATLSPPVEPTEATMTLAFDVSKDGEHASIAFGMGDISSPYVVNIEHREHVGWLPGRLVELIERWKPIAVGCNGAGPAGAQVGPVLSAFRDAGIDANLLRQLSAPEYKQACGGFYTDVVEGRLKRPDGQGPLDRAAADAAERPLGDAWAWDLRSATVPISPLVACTIARALLPIEAKVVVDVAANVW